ncbi:MAG: GumC family protein [Elainellaceae cyanobacterium]
MQTMIYSESSHLRASQSVWQRYLIVGIVANVILWTASLIFIKAAKPTYVSEWSVTLPGGGVNSNVNLPQIGSADTTSSTPFNNVNRDPRENYKFLITSRPVIESAASLMGIPAEEFGKPQVDIIENTTLMGFSIEGETPERAQEKALALNEALRERLESLREQEAQQQDSGARAILEDSQERLQLAQQRLSEFKAQTGFADEAQIQQLSGNIEALRRDQATTLAQQQQSRARLGQLSSNLNVSPAQATVAFSLREDRLFQENLLNYSETSANFELLSSQLGPNHPAVVAARSERDSAEAAMMRRGREILGTAADAGTLTQLNLSGQDGSTRAGLFEETVIAQVDQQGLAAQANELGRQVSQMEGRLRQLSEYGSTLESLRRDLTIAEAIFSSTLTRLDLGRNDVFGSYPLIQLLTEPTLPEETASPKIPFVLLGTAAGSVLITAGIILLWLRHRMIIKQSNQEIELITLDKDPQLNKVERP